MPEPRCLHCGAPIISENEGWLVACKQCKTPHFQNPEGFSHSNNVREKLALLERYTITQTPDGVEVQYKELTIVEGIIATIVLSILVVVIVSVFPRIAIALILIVPLSAYGIVLGIVNRTTISLLANRIETTDQTIDTPAIEQARCVERIESDGEGTPKKRFDVGLKLKHGDDMLLVRGLEDPTEAHYLGWGIQQLYHLKANPQFDSIWYLFDD